MARVGLNKRKTEAKKSETKTENSKVVKQTTVVNENETNVPEEQETKTVNTTEQAAPVDEKVNEVKQEESKQEENAESVKKTVKPKTLKASAMTKVFKDMKLEEAIAEGKKYPNLKDIAETFERYIKNFNMKDGDIAARLNYSIYTVMKSTVEKDYNDFLVRFRYINILICKGKKDKLNETRLLSHDFKWKWGGSEFKRYMKLVTALVAKCEHGVKNLHNVISVSKIVKSFNGKAAENLQKYFTA